MQKYLKKFSVLLSGILIGAALTVYLPAIADHENVSGLPLDELHEFAEVFGKIKTDYVDPVSDKKLIDNAISGMLSGLDPHSQYFNAADFKDLQDTTQGQFGGLGIEVTMENGFVKVVSPIEDTPAQKAGLQTGDLIIKIDDTPVSGMSINDAVKHMRGAPDTPISLTIVRKGVDKPFVVKMLRAIIKVKSVKYKLVEPNYGYVRITEFQERTGANLAQAITVLAAENKAPLKGIVLDLRNNPGGLLTSAVSVSSVFLPANDLIVYTEGRTPDSKMRLSANPSDYLQDSEQDYLKGLPAWIKTIPMVVLINGGSASASEIVSGALQDHKRAVLMGTQSFGKGSVQTVLPLSNGTGMKITTARYFTPSGRSIQAKGITPDIIVEEGHVVNNPEDQMLSIHEADLENHISNPNKTPASTDTKKPLTIVAPKDSKPAATTPAFNPDDIVRKDDFQLNQAVSLLKGVNILAPTPAPPVAATVTPSPIAQ